MPRQYRQLQEIRQDLAARLGFGGAAGAGSLNVGNLNSALQVAQDQLWQDHDWHHLITFKDETVGFEQNELDYPTDCHPDRILSVAVWDGYYWWELHRGIDWSNRDFTDDLDRPYRYECYEHMELHPKADKVYPVKIQYVAKPGRFTQDGDRASIDDNLVLLHALATLKAHYRHPDAQMIASQLQTMLANLKSRSAGKRVHKSRRSKISRAQRIDAHYNRPVNASNNV